MTDRGPGWPTVLALTLVVVTFSVIHPLQLMLVPLAFLLVALPPRAPRLIVLAGLFAFLAFGGPRGPLWHVERGWSLLLAGWFLVAVVVWPGASFVARAVAAVGATVVTGGAVLVAAGGWAELDWTISSRYREVAEGVARAWPGEGLGGAEMIERAAELPAELFPSLLAVGSLAALAIAWWGYSRLARRGRPLGRLPEFRFPDPLVWVLIAGIMLLLFSPGEWAPRLGSNLVFFMGALYVLRGLAVVVALVGPHLPALLVLAVIAVILYPIVVAGSLVVGVTDTWLDLRSGRGSESDEG